MTSRGVRGLVLAAALSSQACEREGEPRAQWIVHVGTDAPLPSFGDRIRIEVLDEDGAACPECVRVFDVRAEEGPLSFGIVPEGGATWVRARMYRAEAITAAGEPLEPVLDVVGRLPELGTEPLDVAVLLTMDCFGQPADPVTKRGCDPRTGETSTEVTFPEGGPDTLPEPGSWRFGEQPCNGDAPEGMICVPGGTFLLGSRIFRPEADSSDPSPEQLVHLSPYFIDVDEMTAGTYRSLRLPPTQLTNEGFEFCSYDPDGTQLDAYSINCLDRDLAARACEAQGKRLPTEAEWEYAAAGAALDSSLPWSIAEPSLEVICRQAVLARDELFGEGSRVCLVLEPEHGEGPQPGGAAADVNFLGLRNMAGNLAEWVADTFVPYTADTCWGDGLELHEDPVCEAPGRGSVRGGHWRGLIADAYTYSRQEAVDGAYDSVGVRCVRDAR